MRPYTIPARLKPLTEDQFNQLHTWLDDLTYDKVREKLHDEFGIEMSASALCRYNQTRDLARHLTEKEEDTTAVRDFLAIINGKPVPYGEAGIELVMKRAFDLASGREMTPAKLATLLRVFHYKKNCEWNERRHTQNDRRLAQNDQRIEISDRLAKVREQELALKKAASPNRTPDHPKIPVTPELIRARVIAKYGFDAEELARKAQERAKAAANPPVAASLQGAPPFNNEQLTTDNEQKAHSSHNSHPCSSLSSVVQNSFNNEQPTTNNEQNYETNTTQNRMPGTP